MATATLARHSRYAGATRGQAGIATALVYVRVSGREQEREGLSLPAQIADCQRYVRDRQWIIGNTFQDVMKGTRDDRPQYQAMLAEARRLHADGTEVVIVVKWLHRLGRRVLESVRCREELKALGVPVHSVMDGGQVSDFVANIMASTAQYEVEQLGERVAAVFGHLTRAGWHKPGGPAPWGYCWRRATPEERAAGAPKAVLEVDAETAPYVRDVFARVARGESLTSVSRWAAELPDGARGGRVLTSRLVSYLFRSGVYVGRHAQGEPDVLARPVGRWPALVSDATWAAARARIDSHQRIPHQATLRYLLSGFARCPLCGGRMSGGVIPNHGRRARRYQCGASKRGANGCRCTMTADAGAVETLVLAEVTPVLARLTTTDPTLKAALQRAWRALQKPADADNITTRRKALETRLDSLRLRVARATERYCDDLIGKAEYDALCERAQADVQAAQSELAGLATVAPATQLPPLEVVLRELGGLDGALAQADIAAQRAVLGHVLELVVPIRKRVGHYRVVLTWTPLGQALRQLATATRVEAAA